MNWFHTLLSGRPHFYIGGQADPYMLRWYLIPRNRWLNVYQHKFMRDDDDRALHDHPWWFVSLVIRGGYREHLDAGASLIRRACSVAFRPAAHRHRVALFPAADGGRRPCWTLIITGRKSRTWGFWCPKGFVPWFDLVAGDDPGAVGKGCGDE